MNTARPVRAPAIFLSHGSPLHALSNGAVAHAWQTLGREAAEVKAVLVVSAHWNTGIPMLSGTVAHDTIHDFGGFPAPLYRIRYPAVGLPALAEQARGLLRDAGLPVGIDGTRGLDHGAWVPLLHMFPLAQVPVVALSVQPELCARHHYAVGRALASLRDQGVLILASGHMTHNLRDAFARPDLLGQPAEPMPYVRMFSEWVGQALRRRDTDALLDWSERAPEARRAHPTPEHFLPLFVALGAAADDVPEQVFVGTDGPALAMDAWRWS